MHSQLKAANRPIATRLNWLPQRSCVLRRALRVDAAASGTAPPPAKELPNDTVTRQYRRTVYDFSLWAKHRDVNRYVYNLKTIPGSRIIRTLGQPMGVVLAWAALFGFYETCLESGVLPSYLPKLTLTSAEPQGLTSFALSLLLVFRTNSSYGRFDEARKIWGGILNRARNIANQAVTFIPTEDAAGREAVAKWTVGFCRALQAHLQEDADLRAELQRASPRWSPQEIDMLCNAQHRPIKAISMLSELTRQLSISEFQALQMQENVTFFYDALGGCERLLRTPIPVSYTRHTARFLVIWLSLLPLGLWDRYHWSMLPVIALIGFLLLGIDEIGITIEEPFGILPLDAICTRAHTDVNSLLKDDPEVSKYIAEVREGRIRPPPAEPAAAAAAPTAATSGGGGAVPVVVPTVARSNSPASQQSGVIKTVTSLFSNVKNGIGAVAPAPPRTPSPQQQPRGASPSRPSNPFPRASAGTGMVPPTPVPPPIRPPASPVTSMANGGGAKGGAAGAAAAMAMPQPAAMSGGAAGFTIPSLSGLSDAAAKLSKLADSMTAGNAPPPASAKPTVVVEATAAPVAAKPAAKPSETPSKPRAAAAASAAAPAVAAAPPSVSVADAGSNGSGADDSRSGSVRRPANWREELAALRATREAGGGEDGDGDGPLPSASYDNDSRFGFASGSDDAEDEALRRFGGLAGRSRSASGSSVSSSRSNGHGNGYNDGYSNGNGTGASEAARSARPRTRPDWRNQL